MDATCPNDAETLPRTITVREFIDVAHIAKSTAYRLIRLKTIPSVRIGKRILIPRKAVVKLLSPSEET
jgi:excisionase family DNA binding protein